MNPSELRLGDVLLHSDISPGVGARGIRLITGSKFTHCALVLATGEILEQGVRRRIHSNIIDYRAATLTAGEYLMVARPRFPVDLDLSKKRSGVFYGWLCIIDALINHALGRAYQWGWIHHNQPEGVGDDTYRPVALLSRLGGYDCSSLVAATLRLETRPWCSDVRCVEPDDFANHIEDFDQLGMLKF